MPQALAQEGELIQPLYLIDKDFISFRAKCHEFARGADLQVGDLVGVRDLGDWLGLAAVQEEDRAARARRHKFKLVVAPLAHRRVEAILSLAHLNALLLLQVVRGERAVRAARMDHVRLLNVGEQRDNVFLLVYIEKR